MKNKGGRRKGSKNESDLVIPRASVKRVIKNDKDVKLVSSDAVLLITKATELFMQKLGKMASTEASKNGRRQLRYEDVYNARLSDDNMLFLEGVLPEPKLVVVPAIPPSVMAAQNAGSTPSSDPPSPYMRQPPPPPLPEAPPSS